MRYQPISSADLTKYPSPSVFFEYFIPNQKDTILTLKIIDDKGRLVREFSSVDEKTPEDPSSGKVDMATGFRTKGFKADLKTENGIHRFSWDMRYTGFSANGKNGVLAAPGTYLIEFNYGQKKYSQNFQLLMDPRLQTNQITPDILKQQVELSLQIRDVEWQAKDLAAQLKESIHNGVVLSCPAPVESWHNRMLKPLHCSIKTRSVLCWPALTPNTHERNDPC